MTNSLLPSPRENLSDKDSRAYILAKIQESKILINCQRFGDLFLFRLVFRQNIIMVGSKSRLLTWSSNITLSLPSYSGSAVKRELNFCNGYLSLLYFCILVSYSTIHYYYLNFLESIEGGGREDGIRRLASCWGEQ